MINFPLTAGEEKVLKDFKKLIESLDTVHDRLGVYNSDNEELIIIDTTQERETWLNILNMAERGNEILSNSWRTSGREGIDFL